MSKNKTLSVAQKEIARLNEIIDRKIIRGENYSKEASRHRALLSEIRQVGRLGWIARQMSFMTLF